MTRRALLAEPGPPADLESVRRKEKKKRQSLTGDMTCPESLRVSRSLCINRSALDWRVTRSSSRNMFVFAETKGPPLPEWRQLRWRLQLCPSESKARKMTGLG